jgi:SAM-dependent methyltransferase
MGDSRCLACGSGAVEAIETVAAESLAEAWSESGAYGGDVSAEAVRAYVLADLGADEVGFLRCLDCGLELAQPMRSWTGKHYPREAHSLGFDHQLALAELQALAPIRILDIGCADGQFLERAAAMGHDVVGIDFSEEDVCSANERGLKAYVADISEIASLVCGGGKFDLITLFQVIEHLSEPDRVFEQILAVAEPDALMMIGCPSDLRYTRVYWHRQRIGRSDFWDYPPQHLLRWTPRALGSFLKRHGWRVEKVVYEPLSVLGAAGHMVALRGLGSSWYENGWSRRLVTLWWLVRLGVARFLGESTGMRLFVKARRLG